MQEKSLFRVHFTFINRIPIMKRLTILFCIDPENVINFDNFALTCVTYAHLIKVIMMQPNYFFFIGYAIGNFLVRKYMCICQRKCTLFCAVRKRYTTRQRCNCHFFHGKECPTHEEHRYQKNVLHHKVPRVTFFSSQANEVRPEKLRRCYCVYFK